MIWSTIHGDVVGAYKTGLSGGITKLAFTSKDILIAGSWRSYIIFWEIFETKMITIPTRKEGVRNYFEEEAEKMKIALEYEREDVKKEEEAIELLDSQ